MFRALKSLIGATDSSDAAVSPTSNNITQTEKRMIQSSKTAGTSNKYTPNNNSITLERTSGRRGREEEDDANDSLISNNNNANQPSIPHNTANSATSSMLEMVTTVLLGGDVTFQDPRTNAKMSTQFLPQHLDANCVVKIVDAGREILFQQQHAGAQQERERFTDRECARAVAVCLVQLHDSLGENFALLDADDFNPFARWRRTPTIEKVRANLVECLTQTSFNNTLASRTWSAFAGFFNPTKSLNNDTSQSVLEILNPLLDIAALQTVADVALTRTRSNCDYVTGFRPFAQNLEKVGCLTAMTNKTSDIFCTRLVAVPALQKCGFADASSFGGFTSRSIGEMKSECLNNVAGSSGSGKTLNSMLYSASWNSRAPGVTLLLDMKEDVFPQYDTFKVEDDLQRLNDGGPFKQNVRGVICSTSLVNAVAGALGSSARVDIPNENDSCDDDLQKFLTDNFTNSFTQLRIGKKFRGKVVIVVDEIGSFPWFHRGLRSVWDTVRMFLKEQLHLESEDQLFLITAGTGSENVIELGVGSREETNSTLNVDAPKFFREALKELAKSRGCDGNANVKRWAEIIFNLLYIKQDTLGLERGKSSQSEYVLKQTNLDSRTYYFARMVTYNCRCAALALKLIIETASANESACASDQSIERCFRSKCSEWTKKITMGFRNLNSLKRLHPCECYDAFAEAIRAVMLHQKSLPEGDTTAFCVVYGLLEDRARIVSDFEQDEHELIKKIGSEYYLVVPKGTPRYHISETFVVMFLRYIGCCHGSSNSFTYANDMFELATADHHALVASLGFSQSPVPDGIAYTPLQEPSNTLAATELKPFVGSYHAVCGIERFFCQGESSGNGPKWLSPTHPEQAVWDKWREIITEDKGCVVIVNDKMAPFADVIVLTPGRVFLTRCKNRESGVNVKEENMLESRANEELREALAKCCQVRNKVEFMATNVVLSTMTKVEEVPAKPLKRRKVNGITWSFVQNPTVFVLDEKQNKSIYSSFLYPVLCNRIQNNSNKDDEDDGDQ